MRQLLFVILLLVPSVVGAHGSARPNILVIVADDLGSTDMSFRGDATVHTPNIDRLAEEGLYLGRFYSQPWCAPTRAALLTGAAPRAWAFRMSIPPETRTIARRFQDAGYQTALIGKWHLGVDGESHPNEMGFDHFYGLLGGFIHYYTKKGPIGYDWQRNGVKVEEDGYSTTLLGLEAERFITDRDATRPFFVFLSFNAVHGPLSAPAEAIQWHRENTACLFLGEGRCLAAAVTGEMDAEIGRVLDALEAEGIADETLIVFFSDNGGLPPFSYNGGLRGGKGSTYEGGIRVGALMRWPGVIEPGSTAQVVQTQDLYATFEHAARLPRRAPRESVDRWRQIWQRHPRYRTRRHEPLFFTSRPPACIGCGYGPGPRFSAVIDGNWKVVTSEWIAPEEIPIPGTQTFALFDLETDPKERIDESANRPEIAARLLRRLQRWETRGLLRTPRPAWLARTARRHVGTAGWPWRVRQIQR